MGKRIDLPANFFLPRDFLFESRVPIPSGMVFRVIDISFWSRVSQPQV